MEQRHHLAASLLASWPFPYWELSAGVEVVFLGFNWLIHRIRILTIEGQNEPWGYYAWYAVVPIFLSV